MSYLRDSLSDSNQSKDKIPFNMNDNVTLFNLFVNRIYYWRATGGFGRY
jgi:hypothetical protein